MRWLMIWLVTAMPAFGKGEVAGEFDYYVLALSWSPNWCVLEGDARRSPQCAPESGYGWVLHGLWPQFHRGYPSYCQTIQPPPSRSMTAAMADIMGTPGLAWHQWKKHGSCTGLSAGQYFRASRAAFDQIVRPEVFRKLTRSISLPASVVEAAFLKANQNMYPDGVTVKCKSHHITEVRICLAQDLTPVPCGRDVIRDCGLEDAVFTPLR